MDSDMAKTTLQATVLAATSNILAQVLASYRKSKPFIINFNPVFQFIVFTLLNCPPNIMWQHFLESTFPGFYNAPMPSHEKTKDKPQYQKKLNWTNTALKLFVDQTIGASLNTVFFLAGMGALKGLSYDSIVESVKTDFVPLMLAGYKLWPMVALLSFTVIPIQHRILFGSLVGVGWGIFLSLFAQD